MGAEKIIPGHGPVGTNNDIVKLIDYINHVKDVVENGKNEEKTLKEVLTTPIPETYKEWKLSSFSAIKLKTLYNK